MSKADQFILGVIIAHCAAILIGFGLVAVLIRNARRKQADIEASCE